MRDRDDGIERIGDAFLHSLGEKKRRREAEQRRYDEYAGVGLDPAEHIVP